MRTLTRIALAAALVAAVAATSGCVIRREHIENPRSEKSQEFGVALDLAKASRVKLEMGAGELNVEGDDLGPEAFKAKFTYQPASLAPEYDSTGDPFEVQIEVYSPKIKNFNLGRGVKNVWDVRLAQNLPTDLSVRMGAGEATLDLSDVEVTELDVEMGAGESSIDLTGDRKNDVEGRITHGAGEVTIRLPKDVGVRVAGRKDGVGDWNYDGFRTEGDYLVNDAYGTAKTNIELRVQRGVGEVTLELVD